MKIIRLDVKETESGWHLKDARFDDINLLVGVSGVGKTKIVEALRTLAQIVSLDKRVLAPMSWTIEFEHDQKHFTWQGEIAGRRPSLQPNPYEQLQFVRERLELDGSVIVERNEDQFEFKKAALPKLRKSQSALTLLSEEPESVAARLAFMSIHIISGNVARSDGVEFEDENDKSQFLANLTRMRDVLAGRVDAVRHERITSFLHAAVIRNSMIWEENIEVLIAYAMQQHSSDQFSKVRDEFCDIFPSVTDVTVDFTDKLRKGGDSLQLQFAIKEQSSNQWILQPQMSSGMLRTLLHLFAIDTALPGSVLIVDEFENSLGTNCLRQMTETMLEHLGEIQFILTSHHPYVINKIPVDCWQLVRRRGSTVTLTSARDIPALMDESHHDALIRLLNLDDYENGIEFVNEAQP